MKTNMMWTLACIGLALSPACGGDDNNTANDGGNDGTAQSDAPTNPNDAGNPNDSSNPTDSSPTSKPNYGYVTLSQTSTGNTNIFSGSAAFYGVPQPAGGCAGTQNGSCCYVGPGDGGTSPTPTAVSAGAITIKEGTTSIGTITPNGTTYTAISNPPTTAFTWAAGDTLAISAAGDTVHAFSGNVTAVSLFTGVQPALSEITPTTINRSSDFTITWTSKTGSISLVLGALKGLQNTPDGTITCNASSDSGTMTVPAALLGNFTANDSGTITLTRASSADASPDNATVTISEETSDPGRVTFD